MTTKNIELSAADLLPWLEARLDQQVEELGTYVSMESGSLDVAGVNAVGEVVANKYRELGFEIERIPEKEVGDHLIARRKGRGKGRLFATMHLDTIWPKGSTDQVPFSVVDGKAVGPGILDMKGGWVVLLEALRSLDHTGWDGFEEVVVFMTGDEQIGSRAGRPWIEKTAAGMDWSIVMEPARQGGHLCIQRSPVGSMMLTIHGKTAHATRRHLGADAIEELAHKILEIRKLARPEEGVMTNVGIISGGSARQAIADFAQASVDIRAPDPAQSEELENQVRAIADHSYVEGTTSELTGGMSRPPFETTPEILRMLAIAQESAREIGLEVDGVGTQGGSDGCFTAAMGIPTLDGLGPDGGNSGSREEYVEVKTIPERAALLAATISKLPSRWGIA